MKIANVNASVYRVPVDIPLREDPVAIGFVVVRIETDTGIVGYGACGGPVMVSGVAAFINDEAGPFVTGDDPLRTERVWHKLFRRFNQRYWTGLWGAASAGIDIALWDIKGKHFGLPVSQLLGGAYDRAPAYVTFGLPEYSRDELARVATMLVDQGHDKLKMVVGAFQSPPLDPEANEDGRRDFIPTVLEDAERVRTVREAVGDDVEIMIDANYKLSLHEAKRLCQLVEPYRIAWFEEPVAGNDYRLLRQLRAHTTIPIAAGQQLGHLWAHRDLLLNEAIDISQPNVCLGGGYTEAVKVAAVAKALNLPIANGGAWPYHNMHLHAGVPNGGRVEFHWLVWKACKALFDGTPEPENGWVSIPDRPGLGFEPNAAAMDRYRSAT